MSKRTAHSEAFKAETLHRLNEDGMTITALARELGVDVTTIRFCGNDRPGSTRLIQYQTHPLSLNKTQRALDLSKEIMWRQQMDIDILKKTMGALSRMPQ